MSRWFRFFIVMLLGVGLGLLYGWVIDPVEYIDTYPGTLREDYKADFVLMIAEAYHYERDIELAVGRLGFLGNAPPESHLDSTLYFAVQSGYSASDLELLRELRDALSDEIILNGGDQQ